MRIAAAAIFSIAMSSNAVGQNPLFIPDTLDGTVFSLNVQPGTIEFFTGFNTPTFGYNGDTLGPTLLINKGDVVTMNVTNNLTTATTVHWHGFHVPPEDDGGPHQIILPGDTWSPSFEMMNDACTMWYHPHGENKTEIQVSKGLAGMVIVRDPVEAAYILPRRYEVDDFPLIVQSKAFDVLYQFMIATHEDSIMMVNGTIDPFLEVPQQVVRLRLLNGSTDRTYLFGLEDNSDFSLIASDGGLLSAPVTTNRLRLSTGERAEILVDFSAYTVGTQMYLKSYASELPKGTIGADSCGTDVILISDGYYSNPLNGADFNILRLDVIPPTVSPVTTIPVSFAPVVPIPEASADVTREIRFTADTAFSGPQGFVDGPFLMNEVPFNMDSINIITFIDNIEIWELTNSTMIAHPFHIHDVMFYVLEINGGPPPPQYQGLKDVILVEPDDTVRFITQFTDFMSTTPYMYHCHLLHHEDDGMMHSFAVIDSSWLEIHGIKVENEVVMYPNPSVNDVWIFSGQLNISGLRVIDELGREVSITTNVVDGSIINMSDWSSGIYTFIFVTEKGEISRRIVKE